MLPVFALALFTSSTLPPSAVRALEARLSSPERAASVAVKNSERRCAVMSVAADALDATLDAARLDEARRGGARLSLPAFGTGRDARGRACRAAVIIDVSWRATAPAVAAGTTLPIRIAIGDLEIESVGVVVPCGAADRDAGLVCARGTGSGVKAVVKGVVSGGALLVQP